jgi:phenylalanyl-tRNA synthetase alpha chain
MSAPNKSYDPVRVAVLSPDEVQRMVDDALAAVTGATSLDELKAARLAHAGDRAPITLANAEIGALPPAARAEAGKRVGAARATVRAALAARQDELEAERDARVLVEEAADVTLPWDRRPAGARHPVTTVAERLSDVFVAMGYEVAEGPEVEDEWYNFDALNFPPDHPAREQYDTIFVAGPEGGAANTGAANTGAANTGAANTPAKSGVVMRTHTSPVQIRAMLARPLPLYVVSPGKCYRTDTLDATHSPVFHQIEGLAVDEGLTMADLRGAITAFVDAMFGEGLRTRLRPDFFPFTEPSADVSMECHVCRGASTRPGGDPCRVCRSQGWIEIAGAGMVNPRVLVACGIDPDRYSGFAFGLGIERTLMIRHGVTDIRDTVEGDVRFSRAFGMEA